MENDWLYDVIFDNLNPGENLTFEQRAKKIASAIRGEIKKRRPGSYGPPVEDANEAGYDEALADYDKTLGIK